MLKGDFQRSVDSWERGEIYVVALQDGSVWIQYRTYNCSGMGTPMTLCLGLVFGLTASVVVVLYAFAVRRKPGS